MIVLDTSALFALLLNEPGADLVEPVLHESVISTVNLAELHTKAIAKKMSLVRIHSVLAQMQGVKSFTPSQAELCGELSRHTSHLGLSLGDRACLTLGMVTGSEVYTTDREWAKLQLPCRVRVIR